MKPTKDMPRSWTIDFNYIASICIYASSKEEAIEKAMRTVPQPDDWEMREVRKVQDYERMKYGEWLDYDKYYIDSREVSEQEFRKFLGDHHFLDNKDYEIREVAPNKWDAYTSTAWTYSKVPDYVDSIYGDMRTWGGQE